ncbi:enoyl-CoA hydratase/isomerase [Pestalotiopsis sp. NC0098]|nr:enoyl-CoA hydratase/isomerase [Pestalotiopsis sp. NC0098]
MAAKTLFTVPIPPLKDHVGGEIVCTEPAPEVYLLTFSSPPDNRLTPAFCGAMLRALDQIELRKPSPTGVVITTSAIPKFYSNGLDLDLAIRTPGFTEDALYPLFHRFLTFPMPTIAVLNGHAFAGGFMLAMHHDYRVFAGDRGYMCINELEFGAPLLPPMSGIFRTKLRPEVYRTTVLEARRWDAKAGLEAGFIDRLDGLSGALAMVEERKLMAKGKTGVYGLLKAEMYREQVALLEARGKDVVKFSDGLDREKRRKAELKKRGAESKL